MDNEAKACLDEVALALQKEPDAKAVIVGHQDAEESARNAGKEKPAKPSHRVEVQDFAAQRAVNTKAYLVKEKDIDASRIGVATSDTAGQTWRIIWFPPEQISTPKCPIQLPLMKQQSSRSSASLLPNDAPKGRTRKLIQQPSQSNAIHHGHRY